MKLWIKFVFLAIAFVYSLHFFLYTNLDDPFYYYNSVMFYNEDLMQSFALWIGYLWRLLTGDNVFSFRLLGWLMGLLSIVIPYFSLLDRKGWKEHIHWFALGVIFMGPMTQGMYVPDAPSVLFLVILSTLVLKYGVSSNKQMCVLALNSAVCTASRFPNILIVILLLILIICENVRKKKTWLHTSRLFATYILLFFASYYFLVAALDGAPHISINHNPSVNGAAGGAESSHSIMALLHMYWWSGLQLFWISTSSIGIYALVRYFTPEGRAWNWISAVAGSIAMYLSWHHFKDEKMLFFVVMIILIFLIWKRNPSRYSVFVLGYVAFAGIIACAGSNTGFMKVYPYYACFSPLILLAVKKDLQENHFNKAVLCMYLYFSVSCLWKPCITQWHTDESLNYNATFSEYHIVSAYPHYCGLLTEEKNQDLNQRLADVNAYANKDHILFYGRPESHEMYAITGTKMFYKIPFYMGKDNQGEISRLVSYAEKDPEMVIFDYTNSDVLRNFLFDRGYRQLKRDTSVSIYKRN